MPVRYLSDPELARLSSWPEEIAVEDAVTYFTLSADDLSWLAGFNRHQNRIGVAVQLSTLPWLGWIPDDLAACPPFALDRLALALGIAPDISSALLAEYGGWQGRTRREHRARVLARLVGACAPPPNASCSTSSCWRGRSNTMPPASCCSWPVTGCAPNGLSVHRSTL
jgi:Domain of unknown function (DUF4158)